MKDYSDAKDQLDEQIKRFDHIIPKKHGLIKNIEHIGVIIDDTEKTTIALKYAALLKSLLNCTWSGLVLVAPEKVKISNPARLIKFTNEIHKKVYSLVDDESFVIDFFELDAIEYLSKGQAIHKEILYILPTPYFVEEFSEEKETLGQVTDIFLYNSRSHCLLIQSYDKADITKIDRVSILIYDLKHTLTLLSWVIEFLKPSSIELIFVNLSSQLANTGYFEEQSEEDISKEIEAFEDEIKVLKGKIDKITKNENIGISFEFYKDQIINEIDFHFREFDSDIVILGLVDDSDDILNQLKISYLRKRKHENPVLLFRFSDLEGEG